jgi:acyl-CoA thioesterase-2
VDLAELLDVLTLRPAGAAVFEGRSPAGRTRSVFGGQFLAQALVAAGRTVAPDRRPHSLHAYFLRGGDPMLPIRYEVDQTREGRGFSHREVRASQQGRETFRMMTSFQVAQPGPEYNEPVEMNEVDPETLPDYNGWGLAGTDNAEHDVYTVPSPVELRHEGLEEPHFGQVVQGPQRIWARISGQVPGEDPLLHAALLAWLSDKTAADFAPLAHGHRWTDRGTDSLSLDHAMWFLRPVRADRWLLYRQGAPSSTGGRGMTCGELCTPDGTRVAMMAQEVLISLPG